MERAYLLTIGLSHLGFALLFLLLYYRGRSRFTLAFAAAWIIETLRVGILFLEQSGVPLEGWVYLLLDLLYVPVTWSLLFCACELLNRRLRPLWGWGYVIASLVLGWLADGPMVSVLQESYGMTLETADHASLVTSMVILFVPGGLVRLFLAWSLFRYWRDQRLVGALIGGIFALPHAAGSLAVPVEMYYQVVPEVSYFLWFVQILGVSIGLLLLVVELQGKDLYETRRHAAQLERLLPLCSSCKSVRTEAGDWLPLEVYFRRRSGETVTHGLCPRCSARLYPELSLNQNSQPG